MSEQNENKRSDLTARIFQIGTAECAVFFALVAMVLALLFLALGFWQTVLIAALMAVGLFIGGVKDKKAWIAQRVNKLFPPKQNVPYHASNEEIQRAVRAVKENQEAAEKAQETAETAADAENTEE